MKPPKISSRIKSGDVVIVVSTDYRDLRKAALQEYCITTVHNACRLPRQLTKEAGSSIGVAFVASALALGVCLGVDFAQIRKGPRGPNLSKIVHALTPDSIAEDIRGECLDGIRESERGKEGDWLAIWGGSSTTAHFTTQLAKLAGLRVISVVNVSKHGSRLAGRGADLLIDNHDPERAIDIIRAVTNNKLKLAIDTTGRETATVLERALEQWPEDNVNEQSDLTTRPKSHLVGLTGLPKTRRPDVQYHPVPIKLFHEVSDVGDGLMIWLEQLLLEGFVNPTEVVLAEPGGLEAVNDGLDRMRRGEISGQRLAVPIV